MDPTRFIDGLERSDDGIWRPGRQTGAGAAAVSYPADGHRFLEEVEERSLWLRARSAALATVVGMHPPGGPIFDLGGGNGFVADTLRGAGFETVVIEPGPGAARALDRGLTVVQAFAAELDLRPASLPAVGLFDVLEHIEDDAGALHRIAQATAPGGRIYLTTPAFSWLWSSHDRHVGHFRRYTRQGLVDRVEAAGFDVDLASYLFAPLVAPLLLLRTLPSALGIRRHWPRMQRVEHAGGGLAGLLEPLLRRERLRLERGGTVPLGTSVIVAAHRQG